MPVYSYDCPECGDSHDELKRVEDRTTDPCPTCGGTAKLAIQAVHLDYLRSGVDTGFPTLAAKWDRLQRNKGSGKQWDSNNDRYGGNYERKR